MPVDVVVVAASKEDAWALRLLAMVSAVNVLLDTGIAREIPVVGRIGPFLVYGVIDQIERKMVIPSVSATASAHSSVPYFEYVLSDTKTRVSKSLPRKTQSTQNILQCAIYARLFNQLSGNHPDIPIDFAQFFFSSLSYLDKTRRLSPQVLTHARSLLCCTESGSYESLSATLLDLDDPPMTLETLLPLTLAWFKFIPRLSSTIEIEYRYQREPDTVLATVKETIDETWVTQRLERGVLFWQGKIHQSEMETFDVTEVPSRCGPCAYRLNCDWLQEQQRLHEQKVGLYPASADSDMANVGKCHP
ncbi:Mitochondrial 5'-3' exonuclease and sliding exonuclease [Rhizoclosmatium sp. JEL0117]|nr:Mitochondrial 5'-3' exonuclease and sliding exonuclease [Rhizoclosmatium sp. JEL0117]